MNRNEQHLLEAHVERLQSLLRVIAYIETEAEPDERARLRDNHGNLLWMADDELAVIRAHVTTPALRMVTGGGR